jgi:DNA-directed RNA polymerase specialized sigma24 family protein
MQQSSGSMMGTLTGNRFEELWPDVANQLNALLSGKRIPAHKREDIVQETGLRLFKMWDSVDPHRPVWPLAVTICLNLLRDEARRGFDREVLGEIPDLPETNDVEHAGIARIEFSKVCRAMARLSPAHRSVLLYEIGGAQTDLGPTTAAVKMLRMRARRKLHSVLETASASSAALLWKFRRSIEVLGQLVGGRSLHHSGLGEFATAGATFLAALAIAGLPGIGSGGTVLPDQLPSITAEISSGALAEVSGASEGAEGLATRRDSARGGGTDIDRPSRNGTNGRDGDGGDGGAYDVPLPVGGSVTAEGFVSVFGYGAEVGDKGNDVPACVRGIAAGSGYVCDSEPPSGGKVRAKAEVQTKAGTVKADVDSGA